MWGIQSGTQRGSKRRRTKGLKRREDFLRYRNTQSLWVCMVSNWHNKSLVSSQSSVIRIDLILAKAPFIAKPPLLKFLLFTSLIAKFFTYKVKFYKLKKYYKLLPDFLNLQIKYTTGKILTQNLLFDPLTFPSVMTNVKIIAKG